MPNSYPILFKRCVCEYYIKYKGLYSINNIIKTFNISNGILYNWIKLYNTNKLVEKVKYNKISKYTGEIKCYIRNYVIKHHNFDYKKLITLIKKRYIVIISKSSIYNILNKMTITRKKFKKRIIPDKKKLKNLIVKFKKEINGISKDDIISIDETSVDTHISPNYGWSLKGTKITQTHKRSRLKYTITSAISNKKVIYNKIIKGSSDGIQFKDFLIQVVSNFTKPMYLLMDNCRIHHSKVVLDYIKETEHKIIYNVPYCPEFNPIEMVFSKFKSIMIKKNNNTSVKLLKNISESFKKISENDLINFYKHSFTF
jgi:transposase